MSRHIILFVAAFLISTSLIAEEQDTGTKFAIAIEDHDSGAIQALLKGGAAVDTPIDYGDHSITPLIMAAGKGEGEIVAILLEAGANVNAKSTDGQETALMGAVTRGHVGIIRTLIEAKADLKPKSTYGFNAFTSAVAAGNLEAAEALLDAGAKIEEGAHTITPLQFAATSGNVEMIRFLIKRGADVNYGAKSGGQTALLSAIYAAKPEAVKALIELKANVNSKTKDGDTPLKAARKGDQEDIIAILKAAGAKQ